MMTWPKDLGMLLAYLLSAHTLMRVQILHLVIVDVAGVIGICSRCEVILSHSKARTTAFTFGRIQVVIAGIAYHFKRVIILWIDNDVLKDCDLGSRGIWLLGFSVIFVK